MNPQPDDLVDIDSNTDWMWLFNKVTGSRQDSIRSLAHSSKLLKIFEDLNEAPPPSANVDVAASAQLRRWH